MHSSNAAFALKHKEIKELIFACNTLRERIIIKLMAYSGLRREEVANLKIEKIDWERNRISFIGKNRLPGTVSVSPDLIQDIQFYLAGRIEGPVFPSRKNGKKTPIREDILVDSHPLFFDALYISSIMYWKTTFSPSTFITI
jgi:integrase